MARLVSAPFFSAHAVFRRAEYAAAVGRRADDQVVTAMLTQHIKGGNIRRIARGVFASVPKHADASKWWVDRFLAASRLRAGGVIAYHSALELHGYAYSEWRDVQIIAKGEPGTLEATGFDCRFVRPPRGFAPPDGVTKIDRLGQEVMVTTLERTVVDLFVRYDLAGGAGELLESLDLIARLNPTLLLRYVRGYGMATTAGALGFWLQSEQVRLRISNAVLDELRTLMPRQPRYALGAKYCECRSVGDWNVILPINVVERRFEGL